jgi:transposase
MVASLSFVSTAAEKARILAEYESLGKADKGALLRREGIYSSLISAWRQQRDQGALRALAKPAGAAASRPGGSGQHAAAGAGGAA